MRWKQFITPIPHMTTEKAKTYLATHKAGSYTLLDVRQPREYETAHLPGAILLPLPELNNRLHELEQDKTTIIYCTFGGRSRAAVQFLLGRGFKTVYNLKGGIRGWQGHTAAGPVEGGMTLFNGNETPQEVIQLAYCMEEGQASVYALLAEKSSEPEIAAVLNRLAEIEEIHKRRLLKLLLSMHPDGIPDGAPTTDMLTGVGEGGITVEEFLDENRTILKDPCDVLSMAMMLETQSLDLYLRYAQKHTHKETRGVILDIAEQEETHLRLLGNLMAKVT